MNIYILLLAVLVFVLLVDFLWLGVIAKRFYDKELKNFRSEKVNYFSAVIVYVMIAFGIVFFVLSSSRVEGYFSVFIFGAFFGLVVYGVYEFTNFALIKDWPLRVVLVDILWGAFLCSAGSLFGKWVGNFW
jgi:uncharacterized membrane protein